MFAAARPLKRLGLVALAAVLTACSTTGSQHDQTSLYGDHGYGSGAPSSAPAADAAKPPATAAAATAADAAAAPSEAVADAGEALSSTPATIVVGRPSGLVTLPGTEADERGDIVAAEVATVEIETPVKHGTPDRDLWQRIRDGFAFPDLPTPLVAQKKRFYLERPEYLQRMFSRGSRYLYHIVEEVERRGMPTELALLPFVESAMNPVAMSSAKASGLWQFIPATGKRYDLEQNWWADNRRDVVRSTDAALQYLQTIYTMHGNDWFLALASYNWGEGAVGRAIRNNRARGKPTGYLDLRMPTETRHYVPKLIAIKQIIADADKLGIELPPLPDEPYFVMVKKTRPIDLKLAARFASMSVEDFVALNPAHNRPVIAASENSMLKIPADRLDGFVAAMARHEADEKVFTTWHPYTLKAGEALADVARRGGVTEAELRRANSIAPGVTVLANTRLLAPQKSVTDDSSVANFSGARIYQQVNVPASYHIAKRRDTMASIARRHGLTVRQLVAFNGGRQSVRPGQRLVIRNPQVQTVLINENGSRKLISSRSTGARAPSTVAASTASKAAPGATKARQATASRQTRTTQASASNRKASSRNSNTRSPSAKTPASRTATASAKTVVTDIR